MLSVQQEAPLKYITFLNITVIDSSKLILHHSYSFGLLSSVTHQNFVWQGQGIQKPRLQLKPHTYSLYITNVWERSRFPFHQGWNCWCPKQTRKSFQHFLQNINGVFLEDVGQRSARRITSVTASVHNGGWRTWYWVVCQGKENNRVL